MLLVLLLLLIVREMRRGNGIRKEMTVSGVDDGRRKTVSNLVVDGESSIGGPDEDGRGIEGSEGVPEMRRRRLRLRDGDARELVDGLLLLLVLVMQGGHGDAVVHVPARGGHRDALHSTHA